MNVKDTTTPILKPVITYPTVRRLKEDSIGYVGKPVIVLFVSRTEGIALQHPCDYFERAVSKDWMPADDPSHWENCTVTLSSQ